MKENISQSKVEIAGGGSSFSFRDIYPGEAAELQRLARRNFSVVEQIFLSKPKMGIVAQTQEGEIAGGAFLLAVDSREKKIGCIDIIFVLPQYRGSGVGKLLYHEAVAALKRQNCHTIMALVRGDNSPSLCRFKAEGLYPTTLHKLCQTIGFKGIWALYLKTAALACATGCWILSSSSHEDKESVGGVAENLLRVFLINGLLLILGALISFCFQSDKMPWLNVLAGVFLLSIITIGETIGRQASKGRWHFVMPEGGLVPAAIVALLGGFYPMLGHWYLIEREHSAEYRRRMAAPAKAAWLLLLGATVAGMIFINVHPFFSNVMDLGIMLLLLYVLPFYPFDTFGGRRIRENSKLAYGFMVVITIIMLVFVQYSF